MLVTCSLSSKIMTGTSAAWILGSTKPDSDKNIYRRVKNIMTNTKNFRVFMRDVLVLNKAVSCDT